MKPQLLSAYLGGILSCLILFGSCGVSEDPETSESTDSITPADTFVSRRPQTEIKTLLTYRERCQINRVKSRTVNQGKPSRKKLGEEKYRQDGRLSEIKSFDAKGETRQTKRYSYASNGNLLRCDWEGDTNLRKVFTNAKGKMVRERQFENNHLTESRFFYYNEKGDLDKTVEVNENCDTCNWRFENFFSYNSEGWIDEEVTMIVKKSDTTQNEKVRYCNYFYNKQGWAIRRLESDPREDHPVEFHYRFNRSGQVISEKVYLWQSDSLLTRTKWTYNKLSLPVRCQEWEGDQLSRDRVFTYTFFDPS